MKTAFRATRAVMMRELYGYVGSPVAYVFIVIFLTVMGFFTWKIGPFWANNEANLEPFFFWQPWLYMLLVPAIGMRLWSEERRAGTLELLFTLPIAPWHAILGKFLAGSAMLALSLALTFPMVLTVNYLGDPDNGVILSGYIGSLAVAMTFLAVSSVTSALTRNQVISFILSFVICLLLNLSGWSPVTDLFQNGEAIPLVVAFVLSYVVVWAALLLLFKTGGESLSALRHAEARWLLALGVAIVSAGSCLWLLRQFSPWSEAWMSHGTPQWIITVITSLSTTPYFERIQIGIIDLRSVVYFVSIITFCMFTTATILQNRRSA